MGPQIQIRHVGNEETIRKMRERHQNQVVLGSASNVGTGPLLGGTPEEVSRAAIIRGATSASSETDDSGFAQVILSVVNLFPKRIVKPIIDRE